MVHAVRRRAAQRLRQRSSLIHASVQGQVSCQTRQRVQIVGNQSDRFPADLNRSLQLSPPEVRFRRVVARRDKGGPAGQHLRGGLHNPVETPRVEIDRQPFVSFRQLEPLLAIRKPRQIMLDIVRDQLFQDVDISPAAFRVLVIRPVRHGMLKRAPGQRGLPVFQCAVPK